MLYENYIKSGFILRLLSIAIILTLPIDNKIKTIAVFATDFLDCWTAKGLGFLHGVENPWKMCKSYRYQSVDKSVDLLTYGIIYVYLGLSPLYLYLILIRLIGISLFYLTLNSTWLILFPDLFKEILLFDWYVAKINTTNFSIIFAAKMIFEYIWHTYNNHNDYKKGD